MDTSTGQTALTPEITRLLNEWGRTGEAFLFVINYKGDEAYVRRLSEIDPEECLYDLNGKSNSREVAYGPLPQETEWRVEPPAREAYGHAFDIMKRHILAGNSYLANLTCPVTVHCNLTLREMYLHTQGKYRLYLNWSRAPRLVCFSPETFVQIREGRISSCPMKGTLDATLPQAGKRLMADSKEAAEHATIVDLIRNDLSRVATEVRVDRYRYLDTLHTNRGRLLQTSSLVSGRLPSDYRQHLGDILAAQLPAGSITGAPKDSTRDIIREAEGYDRGFYTGIMGIWQDGALDSAVMIRYVEQQGQRLCFKAGGGITSASDCQREYEEVLHKVYLPIKER